ncbi:MAG: D-Ala-D-Ala carboxypeptidase family metallohydrolase [Rikenellaceae bacterium]
MKYFSINELAFSSTAESKGIDNIPDFNQSKSIEALVNNILDPAREALGRPIHVNSGFRGGALNKAVGGATTSQHTKGEAADIELGGKSTAENKELYDWIAANCEFDQLINEYNFSWVHVSYKKDGGNRKQQLSIG